MRNKVVIKSSCNFIKVSIEQLLKTMVENKKINSAIDISVCKKDNTILPLSGYDVIFLTFLRDDYTPECLLNLIGFYFPNLPANCKVIIITESIYLRVLKRYMLNFSDSCIVLDASISIRELEDKVIPFLNKENNLSDNRKKVKLKLSQREITVLHHLLKGRDMKFVASHLGINYKTVSSHKRSGLLKFGIRSLHHFVMPKNRINTLN